MSDKEQRIKRLEDQVEKLSNAVSMPTRREAIAAGGLLGAGALLGGGVGDAEAAAVGQVGTSTDRVDVFGASGDFNSVSTDEQQIKDTATDPSNNGEFRRNGTDVKVHSGGSVRNLSNIGSGSGGGEPYATVTVAASDALNTSGADYICDGTNDHTTINNAIASLPSGGGRVVLTEGTFTLGGAITDQTLSNVKITGQGRATNILMEVGVQANIIDLVGVDNWEIAHMTLDGQAENQSDGGNMESQCGIHADNVTGHNYHHLTIRETMYSHVRCRGDGATTQDVTVAHCLCDTARGETDVLADGISFTTRNAGTVISPRIAHNTVRNIANEGIELAKNTQGGTVIDNTVEGCDEKHIHIHSSNSYDSKHTRVIGNICRGNGNLGPHYNLNQDRMTVADNVSMNSGFVAFQLGDSAANHGENITARGNVAQSPAEHGMSLKVNGIIATANEVHTTGNDGIQVDGNNCVVTSNFITGWTNSAIDDNGTGTVKSNNQTV